MNSWSRRLLGAIVGVGCVSAAMVPGSMVPASAETCKLELKRLESSSGSATDYMFRATSSQGFYKQIGVERAGAGEKEFAELVNKEPEKYHSENPLRAVAKLGTQKFAFVLDAKDDESDGYGLLRFDLNHNGDLTDDEVVEAEQPLGNARYPANYSRAQFPRVDVTLDVDGTKVEYGFLINVTSYSSGDHKYASGSLNAAAYREGEITLDGKLRRVFLIDFNSNGRFDDETKVRDDVRLGDGEVYAERGDVLLVDPPAGNRGRRSPYDVTTSDDQHLLSKIVNIDGKFYELKVSPSGDEITLEASSIPVGKVTNPNPGYRAVVYGDQGMLKIVGDESSEAPLPEGEWKLLRYTIDQTGLKQPPDEKEAAEEEEEADEPKERSVMELIAGALLGDSATGGRPSGPQHTIVSARAPRDYKAVAVRPRETVEFPFGPPYKPVVKAPYASGGDTAQLALSLVGSTGEICSDMMVEGQRPGKPEFTITDPDDEEVATGSFEYG